MAHTEQIDYCKSIKAMMPQYFNNIRVLDIGSLDINGNNRYLFTDSEYIGIDIGPGKNVDLVCSGHEFKSDEQFDVVISTECFEHDKHYGDTIRNVVNNLLKPGGLFLFTCATTGRPEHGTTRTSRKDSPFTNDYYKNLTVADINAEVDIGKEFFTHEFKARLEWPQDLYFYGVKHGTN